MAKNEIIKIQSFLIKHIDHAINITNKILLENPRPVRILHLDDHRIYHEGILKCIVKRFPNVIMKHIQNGDTALEYVINSFKNNEQIDLIITDVNHMGLGGIDFSFAVRDKERNSEKKIPILFLTLMDFQKKVKELPSVVYLFKTSKCEEINSVIEKLISGNLDNIKETNRIPNAKNHDNLNSNKFVITPKDRELLILLNKKCSVEEIKEKLGLTTRTIEALKSKLMKKFEVDNINDLIAFAKKKSII